MTFANVLRLNHAWRVQRTAEPMSKGEKGDESQREENGNSV
jgi:hypothetical protein